MVDRVGHGFYEVGTIIVFALHVRLREVHYLTKSPNYRMFKMTLNPRHFIFRAHGVVLLSWKQNAKKLPLAFRHISLKVPTIDIVLRNKKLRVSVLFAYNPQMHSPLPLPKGHWSHDFGFYFQSTLYFAYQ